jgi:hypothetical protein
MTKLKNFRRRYATPSSVSECWWKKNIGEPCAGKPHARFDTCTHRRCGVRGSRGTTLGEMVRLIEALDSERARNELANAPSLLGVQRSCSLLYTAPRTWLSGKGGWRSWKVASIRGSVRAWSACYSVCRHAVVVLTRCHVPRGD